MKRRKKTTNWIHSVAKTWLMGLSIMPTALLCQSIEGWHELKGGQVPSFYLEDGISDRSFQEALATSVSFLARIPEDTVYRIGTMNTTAAEVKSTLLALAEWKSSCRPKRFRVFESLSRGGKNRITAYFEPVLPASPIRTEEFSVPVYTRPSDLVEVDLRSFMRDPDVLRIYGRVSKGSLVNYYSRKEILRRDVPADVLFYLHDADYYQLALQGSGTVILPEGKRVHVAYDGDNGNPFHSALACWKGRVRLERNALKEHMKAHPEEREMWNHNPRYIFFEEDAGPPRGISGMNLTEGRSAAFDDALIPPGMVGFLSLDDRKAKLNRFIFAHDTGSAIKGHGRADLFMGSGEEAESRAMTFDHPGHIYFFLLRARAGV